MPRSGGGFDPAYNAQTVALGREGKKHADINAESLPHMAAVAAKMQTDAGCTAYRPRKWLAEPPNG